MTKKELLQTKKVLATLAISATVSTGLFLYQNKDKSEEINAYVYELDNKDNVLNKSEINADINEIKNNNVMDEYIGKNIKIKDINNNYIIEKVGTNGITTTSYIYCNTDEGYLDPYIFNTTEKEYYKVFNIANSMVKRNINKTKKISK